MPEALPAFEAGAALDALDGFKIVETDEQGPPDDLSPQVTYFLIDRDGIVRWLFVDALDDPADYGSHPSNETLLEAARAVAP